MTTGTRRPRIRFVGTGEAFDEGRVNCSVLFEGTKTLLLDCGPTVPWALWRTHPAADALDALYLSHFHGDHVFGVPFLLMRWHTDGRTAPFTILGQRGTAEHVEALTRLAYRSVWDALSFPLAFVEVEPGAPVVWQGWTFAVAESHHSQRNLSLRLEADGVALGYSGDGAPTEATRALYRGVDVLVHEAYAETAPPPAHASIPQVLKVAREAAARAVALVHLERTLRPRIDAVLGEGEVWHPCVLVPDPGDEVPHELLTGRKS